MSVNVSVRQFRPELVEEVRSAPLTSGLSPKSLVIEITESTLMQDEEKTLTLVHDLKELGVQLPLDDFGTGMASLSYLKQFPVDFVKIDASFVRELRESVVDQAVLRAIADLSRTLEFEIVAEGVEDLKLLPMLRELGATYFQGYGIARPQLLADWVEQAGSPVAALRATNSKPHLSTHP